MHLRQNGTIGLTHSHITWQCQSAPCEGLRIKQGLKCVEGHTGAFGFPLPAAIFSFWLCGNGSLDFKTSWLKQFGVFSNWTNTSDNFSTRGVVALEFDFSPLSFFERATLLVERALGQDACSMAWSHRYRGPPKKGRGFFGFAVGFPGKTRSPKGMPTQKKETPHMFLFFPPNS